MVAEALFVTSATLVAVMVTLPAAFGAAYVAAAGFLLLNVPLLAVQVTPAEPTSFCTAAVNPSDCEIVSPPRTGVIETLICGGGGVEEPELQPLITRTRHKDKKTAG